MPNSARIGVTYFPLGAAAFAVDAGGAITHLVLADDDDAACSSLRQQVGDDGIRDWPGAYSVAIAVNEALAAPWRPHQLILAPSGTPLELAIWTIVGAIPHAATRTYKSVAMDLPAGLRGPDIGCAAFTVLGGPPTQRDVATAASRNPIDGLIPCHRLVRADGKVAARGTAAKLRRAMLARELDYQRSVNGRIRAQERRQSQERHGT